MDKGLIARPTGSGRITGPIGRSIDFARSVADCF
jgi:hypothetical protein